MMTVAEGCVAKSISSKTSMNLSRNIQGVIFNCTLEILRILLGAI